MTQTWANAGTPAFPPLLEPEAPSGVEPAGVEDAFAEALGLVRPLGLAEEVGGPELEAAGVAEAEVVA